MNNNAISQDTAWWKFGHVWLVIAGPAIVVVASFVTLFLAVKGMDPVLDENTYQKSMQASKALATNPASLAPAMQGRNHAQTGVQPGRTAP
jgi:uncharacterized protein